MSDQIIYEDDEAMLELSDAVLHVYGTQQELRDLIFEGFRGLCKKAPGHEPLQELAEFSGALDMLRLNPENPEHDGTRATLVRSLLFMWYRIPPQLDASIMTAVREAAVADGRCSTTAQVDAENVIRAGERTLPEAMRTLQQHAQREAEKKRQHEAEVDRIEVKRRVSGRARRRSASTI